jgi:hypothetical protein
LLQAQQDESAISRLIQGRGALRYGGVGSQIEIVKTFILSVDFQQSELNKAADHTIERLMMRLGGQGRTSRMGSRLSSIIKNHGAP